MNRIAISTIAATVALASALPARAEVRVGVTLGSDRPVFGTVVYHGRYAYGRVAFENGYRDGMREGERDDRRYERYDYRDEGRYRSGDAGYRPEYGPRWEYVSAYRQGFAEGYRRGYANVRYEWRDGRRYDH